MSPTPYVLGVETDVYGASRDFHNQVVDLVKGGLADIPSFPMRWTEQVWHIAINLHAGAFGVDSLEHPLSLKIFEAAIRVTKFFAQEQLKILDRSRLNALEKDAIRVRELITSNGGPITLRDMDRRHGFTEERIANLANRFPRMIEVIKPKSGNKGGRPGAFIALVESKNL
jgi:hypothetical protein